MNRSESDSPTAKSVSLDTAGTAMPPSSSKPSRAAVGAVFGAGVAQGIALVTFPAAGAIFTSPQHYGLSSTQYGMLFVPQAIMAIISSLLGPTLARSLGAKNVFLAGMLATGIYGAGTHYLVVGAAPRGTTQFCYPRPAFPSCGKLCGVRRVCTEADPRTFANVLFGGLPSVVREGDGDALAH